MAERISLFLDGTLVVTLSEAKVSFLDVPAHAVLDERAVATSTRCFAPLSQTRNTPLASG